jgi:Uncharacterized conserved protein
MTGEAMLAVIALAVLAGMVVIYNRLVARKNHVLEAWSGIDVQLKRRHDLIPKLVEAVKAYGHYESGLMEAVTRLRGAGQGGDLAAENGLSRSLRQLLAVVENYPELKASQLYLDLQAQLSDAEEQIQYARRYYNGTVRELNILVQSFPSNLVAKLFGYRTMDYFEIELATQRESPEIEL